ncbi:MAG TPA: CHAT domain-containing protein [Pyrinomonadaceae bacterium]
MADALDIAILDAQAKKRAAVVLARYGSDIAIAELPAGKELKALLDFKDRISQVLLLSQKRPTKKELTEFGHALFAYIVRENVERLYNRLPVNTLIRFHILANRPDLQSLPWEYLQDPQQGAGPWPNRSIVRVIPTIGYTPPAPLQLAQLAATGTKLRILFVYAVPQDQNLVSWPSVKSSIEKAFSLRIPASHYELKVIQGTTEELFAAFHNNNDKYEIFQFSGHGDVDPQTNEGRILLVNSKKNDQSLPMSASQLASILQSRGVRLAVLSACLTSAGNSADPFNVVAEALLASGIPAVVANHLPVPDASVATFVGALYTQLLNTGDIDIAVNEGRLKMAIELAVPQDATLEWGIPTLYRYINGAQVFQP